MSHNNTHGWVYVMTNRALPGICKIGISRRSGGHRASELRAETGLPHPYVVAHETYVQNHFAVERLAHIFLRQCREGKEWFRCTVEEAIEAVFSASKEISEAEDPRVALIDARVQAGLLDADTAVKLKAGVIHPDQVGNHKSQGRPSGRRSHSKTLELWANGEHVGRWIIPTRGEMELQYDPNWVHSERGRPISLSLPICGDERKGARVENYFENLLPDSSAIRARVAERFKTGSTDAFDLLAAIGRDCVGALQLLPEGHEPPGSGTVEGVAMNDEEIERHLLDAIRARRPTNYHHDADDFRVAIAGAQEKHAFLRWDGKWMKPRGATPTTHIFKMPIGLVGGRQADFSTSVDNEWLCLRILKAYGLPTADGEIATFGEQRVLVVKRFDRTTSSDGKRLFRLVQEDFCQATGTSPLVKYENEGGPGLRQLFNLTARSQSAEADLRTLMASQILFWMLRAPDGHAKNFSIHLQPGASGHFRLAPMYDVMSAYPVIGNGPNQWSMHDLKLAMALLGKNRHYHVHNIQRRHFNSTAKKVGYGVDAEPLLQEIISRTPDVVKQVGAELPQGFSQKVADSVLGGLLNAAKALEAMPAA